MRKRKTDLIGRLLVIIKFVNLHLIMTAAMRFADMHAAFTALFAFCCIKLGGCQPVHTVMIINHHTGRNQQVQNGQYADSYFSQDENKDKVQLQHLQ